MEACKEAQTETVNVRLKLLQYKWLMQTYVTPATLHKYNENIPDTCVKCNKCKGTRYHCIWECEDIMTFWKEVNDMINTIFNISLPLSTKTILLHFYPLEGIILS